MLVRKVLGLIVAMLFLLGMGVLTGPDIWIRRAFNKMCSRDEEHVRRTEVRWQLAWARWYLRMVEILMRMEVVIDAPPLWWSGNYLIVMNHRNALDHLVAARVFCEIDNEQPRWIVKEQMRRAPIVGGSLERAGFAFVSRNKDPGDLVRIREMARLAHKDSVSVALYPEGTRFDGKSKDGSRYRAVREPKATGFSTLCEELPGYKVLVICIDWGDLQDARTIWDGGAYMGRHVRVHVWEEDNPGAEGAPALLTAIWDKMEERLTQSRDRTLLFKKRDPLHKRHEQV